MRNAFTPLALYAALLMAGCASTAFDNKPVPVETPSAFRRGAGQWVQANVTSADALERGPWWKLFQDPVLDDLAAQIDVSNQTLAQAVAAYRQAKATVAVQRAAVFPQVALNGGASRSGGENVDRKQSVNLNLGASWEPDLWGRLGLAVGSARAAQQASAADLAAARLSLQGQLAINYFNLRGTDVELALQARTLQGLERSQQIASNRYNAGVVARTDVLQAQTQAANARADLLTLQRQRSQLENAIAVLVGRAPSDFRLPPQENLALVFPVVPPGIPSTLLLRRPDIVAAERRVATAKAQVGLAQTAWYPSLNLTGSAGLGATTLGELFSTSNLVWALGVSLAQTVFDGGAIAARLDLSQGALDQAAAKYRETVLEAFQSVEDQLAAAQILTDQLTQRQEAADAAERVEQQVLNRYQVGQVGYTDVITAQTTAQAARRALVELQASRQVAAVSLIQALGGGWRANAD